MCSKRKTAEEPASRQPPPFVLALDDYDPYKSENIYDAKPSFTAPSIDTQIAVTRGEKLAVLSNEIDWWILCKSIDFDKQGYVPTILFAPVCVAGAEDRYECTWVFTARMSRETMRNGIKIFVSKYAPKVAKTGPKLVLQNNGLIKDISYLQY